MQLNKKKGQKKSEQTGPQISKFLDKAQCTGTQFMHVHEASAILSFIRCRLLSSPL